MLPSKELDNTDVLEYLQIGVSIAWLMRGRGINVSKLPGYVNPGLVHINSSFLPR